MRITAINEAAKDFLKERYIDSLPCHKVFTRHRIAHYVYVFSHQFRTDGFINFAVRRDDNLDYFFRGADFHHLHPQDIQDMYLSNISYKHDQGNEDDIRDALKIFMRSQLSIIHVDDLQMGVESLQKKANLTHPMITIPDIDEYELWTCIEHPLFKLGLVNENASGYKRLMITNDIPKFSSGMLKWVLQRIHDLLDQDHRRTSTEIDDDQKAKMGLFAQYVEERLYLRSIWGFMEKCVGYRR